MEGLGTGTDVNRAIRQSVQNGGNENFIARALLFDRTDKTNAPARAIKKKCAIFGRQ
jgi:hypothetical protein